MQLPPLTKEASYYSRQETNMENDNCRRRQQLTVGWLDPTGRSTTQPLQLRLKKHHEGEWKDFKSQRSKMS